jgi:hypothetical protein
VNPIVRFDHVDIRPGDEAVLRTQGVPIEGTIPERFRALLNESLDLFDRRADPVGVVSELSIEEFGVVFRGEGKNEADNPLERIYPRADRLDLFAVTLGQGISATIESLFETREFALAAMLDSVASLAADRAVEVLEQRLYRFQMERGSIESDHAVLGYSPGYCGWDISGQERLFERVDPGRIGIVLNDNYLMNPLKSVTGVLVTGEREIHWFDNTYPFCGQCETFSCRLRLNRIARG